MKARVFYTLFFLVGFVFCAQATVYSRVSAMPEAGWAGKYLIVYETDNKAYVWDGENNTNNYVSVTMSNGKISADNLSSYLVTVTDEGNKKYGVKAADGYISTKAKKNGITYSDGAVDCTIQINGGYIMLETNTNTCRFLYNNNNSQFRFFYDDKKKWSDTDLKNIRLYAEGDKDPEPSGNTLDINYVHASMYACDSKFPTQSDPYNQYFFTELYLAQEESYKAVPQVGLTVLAPTQYSIAGHYKSDYKDGQKYFIHVTGGSSYSYFTFPSKAEAGYSTAAITLADMTITTVGPSKQPNAYVYHIKLEFTDSNKKIWILDKDIDVYAWWIDCDRSGKEKVDMDPVAFTLESGKHEPAGIKKVQDAECTMHNEKIMKDGKIYLLVNGAYYSILGNKIK